MGIKENDYLIVRKTIVAIGFLVTLFWIVYFIIDWLKYHK
jgi:hypothetical protein